MKKQSYFAPKVEVLLMNIERGFTMSGEPGDVDEVPADEWDY